MQPFAGHGRSVENEAHYGGQFYQLCRQHNPKVKLWLYQQWPDQQFGESWSKGQLPLGGTRAAWESRVQLRPGESIADGGWQGTLLKTAAPATWSDAVANHTRYFEILLAELQRQYPGQPMGIMPGGPALAKLKAEMEAGRVPGLKNFFPEMFADGVHLTSKGRYLIALVHYACLYGESPVGKVSPLNSNLTEEQARLFQQIAWESVRSHPTALNPATSP